MAMLNPPKATRFRCTAEGTGRVRARSIASPRPGSGVKPCVMETDDSADGFTELGRMNSGHITYKPTASLSTTCVNPSDSA